MSVNLPIGTTMEDMYILSDGNHIAGNPHPQYQHIEGCYITQREPGDVARYVKLLKAENIKSKESFSTEFKIVTTGTSSAHSQKATVFLYFYNTSSSSYVCDLLISDSNIEHVDIKGSVVNNGDGTYNVYVYLKFRNSYNSAKISPTFMRQDRLIVEYLNGEPFIALPTGANITTITCEAFTTYVKTTNALSGGGSGLAGQIVLRRDTTGTDQDALFIALKDYWGGYSWQQIMVNGDTKPTIWSGNLKSLRAEWQDLFVMLQETSQREKPYLILANESGTLLHEHILTSASGTTASRPGTTNLKAGYQFFDTTLGKPIWWKGAGWVDATGTTV